MLCGDQSYGLKTLDGRPSCCAVSIEGLKPRPSIHQVAEVDSDPSPILFRKKIGSDLGPKFFFQGRHDPKFFRPRIFFFGV